MNLQLYNTWLKTQAEKCDGNYSYIVADKSVYISSMALKHLYDLSQELIHR